MDKQLKYLKETWEQMREFDEREFITTKGLTPAQIRVLKDVEPQDVRGQELERMYPFPYNKQKIMARQHLCQPDGPYEGALTIRGATALVALWDQMGINKDEADKLWYLIQRDKRR